MAEKIKVSREVADAIETLGRDRNVMGRSVNDQLQFHAERSWKSTEREPLNELSLEELAAALIVGYEVEKTPHEVIAKEYAIAKKLFDTEEKGAPALFNRGVMVGIKRTLRAFQITVKGVNDNDDAN